MFGISQNSGRNAKAVLTALDKSLATIEFDTRGVILKANPHFCQALGYDESEIVGKHHRIFVEAGHTKTAEYQKFWDDLANGVFGSGEYMRIDKSGKEIWIQATYNPIMNKSGKVVKVVKFASDITDQKAKLADFEGKMNAISRAQAVIEFDLDGNIQTANENFCTTVGYSLNEIIGRHHSIFVEQEHANSKEYAEFWPRLRRGEFFSSEFKRIGKGGKEVFIQASYNPIFDSNGKVHKVVKFATDITARVNAVNKIGQTLKALAAGDLTSRINDRDFDKDMETLRTDLNSAIGQLGSTFGGMLKITDSLGTGVREIVAASTDLSTRTEKQAMALEETAATLNTLTEAVLTSAENAAHTQTIAKESEKDAQKSGEVVERALNAMSQIERSASEIRQIISTIDEIAFQTNLLALNAGVEAARAGEAGQGFAVVAAEVRALAQRSAESAKEIAGLITKSDEQVSEGSKLVTEAGETLKRIATQVLQISGAVNGIAQSSAEQSETIKRVNATVSEMEQGTQQNAAMAEEATAACHSLQNEAGELENYMSKFQVSEHEQQEYAMAS